MRKTGQIKSSYLLSVSLSSVLGLRSLCCLSWYSRLHVEDLSTVHLHLHCLFVQHSDIISEQIPNITLNTSLHGGSCAEVTHLKRSYLNLLAKAVASHGPRSKIIPNIGQSVCFSNLDRQNRSKAVIKELQVELHNLKESSECKIQWQYIVLRMNAVRYLSYHYPSALLSGVTLICVLVHGYVQFACIFHAAVWEADCEKKVNQSHE